LLAKITIQEAKSAQIKNSKYQEKVESYIKVAEKAFNQAEQEIIKNCPNTAITKFSKAWLNTQLAIKFANF
jgi:hypothetical protein